MCHYNRSGDRWPPTITVSVAIANVAGLPVIRVVMLANRLKAPRGFDPARALCANNDPVIAGTNPFAPARGEAQEKFLRAPRTAALPTL